jgi:hypothetical protein
VKYNLLKSYVRRVLIYFSILLLFNSFCSSSEMKPYVLFDFEGDFEVSKVETRYSSASLITNETGHALRIKTNPSTDWSGSGISLKAQDGKWDLSNYEYVEMDVKNVGNNPVTVWCRWIDIPFSPDNLVSLDEGESGKLKIRLSRIESIKLSEPVEFISMRGAPSQRDTFVDPDPEKIEKLNILVLYPSTDHIFEIDNIRAGGRVITLDTKSFFPFIDEFGQYIHKDWPGKIHSKEDLIKHRNEEAKDLAENPGPSDWDKYGGWTKGPQLKATGFFRAEKYNGKWWLVDPEGHLFWAHGTGGGLSVTTPITDRRHYFRNLPDTNSPLAQFYGTSRGGRGYYNNKEYETFNYGGANLYRKYGEDWRTKALKNNQERHRSWGLNTGTAAYFRTIRSGGVGRGIEGSKGWGGKFPDPFDSGFREAIRERMKNEGSRSVNDPWCIGYFVDNELSWGSEDVSLALASLDSPFDQPAKKVFISDLKAKYGTIDRLNTIWGTNYASWDIMMQSRNIPDKEKAWQDLAAFHTRLAETYFRICREEVKRGAPNQLYLGCRFNCNPLEKNVSMIKAAAKYCDVISFNYYVRSCAKLSEHFGLPKDFDIPAIITEFHFGALDRGLFYTGLLDVNSQEERGETYKQYVRGALAHPLIVGTEWFQYRDQLATGRTDGENYQIGFVDVCDTPYEETVQACREVGYNMYEYRLKSK